MTTRKIKMVRRNTYLDSCPATFDAIYKYLQTINFDFDKYTAKQIAEIMEICKAQNEMGFDEGYKEAKD